MADPWLSPSLGEELLRGDQILGRTSEVVKDITAGVLSITLLVQNMSSVLTHKDAERRERGIIFFTNILKALPPDFLTEMQLKFIAHFYTDRLKENHRVIPPVIEGYLAVVQMRNLPVQSAGEFFTVLFREVACQSQLRPDRYNIYSIVEHLLDTRLEYMKTLGPDFIYGVISAMDGERDPRNLMFLFAFLPKFMRNIPLGHLAEEMFDVVSCYFPIDFTAAPGDPDAVSRQDLADALAPCLCAVPDFGEQCLLLMVEKLDSSLRLAKIDSLQLLRESCKVFDASVYTPFLKTLWSSLQRELYHKTDNDLKMAAHRALYALVQMLAESQNTDQTFENFVKGVLISMQTALADATTTITFNETAKILLTCANASKPSCLIIVQAMIPSTIAYHNLKLSDKVQVAALNFLVKLCEVAQHWCLLNETRQQMEEIPQLCLSVVSEPKKEHHIAGLKTVVGTIVALNRDLVLPFVEVLTYNVHHARDEDLMSASVECIHAIATKYPEQIMEYAVMNKFNLKAITEEKEVLLNRLRVLSKLASLDSFTETIIEKMLGIMTTEDAHTAVVVLNASMSDIDLYSEAKVEQIERDHNFVDSVLTWLLKEVSVFAHPETITYGYSLISMTISRLSSAKQSQLIEKHTETVLSQCRMHESYLLILEALYNSLRQDVFNKKFISILDLCTNNALNSEHEFVRMKAGAVVAHLLNKVESESDFDAMYSIIKNAITLVENEKDARYPRVIQLCGLVVKSLILRGTDLFIEWLEKIVSSITNDKYGMRGAEAIKLIVTDDPICLSSQCHCRTSLFYKQRLFQTFLAISEKQQGTTQTKESYLLGWAYILGHIPKNVLISHVEKIADLIIQSLSSHKVELLLVMLEVLCHVVRSRHACVARSLQTLMPRLLHLTTHYVHSMDVRINSLECLYWLAESYPTPVVLPHRAVAVEQLARALDDRKRLVRAAAVRARSRWILVGSPGEAEP